jgi:F-type H+-transporting ATPase subunit delta
MAVAISRRKLAYYVADMIVGGKIDLAVSQLAAFLVQTNRTREAGLVVRDIEAELASRGIVVATVTSACALGDDLKQAVRGLLNAKEAYVTEVIDRAVLGGIRIDMPGKQYDATVRRKLELLKELTLV